MLPLVGEEITSANRPDWKIDIDFEAWRKQQACQQRETPSPWLVPAVSHVCRGNGKKHPAQLWSVPFLSHG
jgi:hypothetical protein